LWATGHHAIDEIDESLNPYENSDRRFYVEAFFAVSFAL
jgi:hypothetical protein